MIELGCALMLIMTFEELRLVTTSTKLRAKKEIIFAQKGLILGFN